MAEQKTPEATRLVFRVVIEGPLDAMKDPAEWARYFQSIAHNNLGCRDEFRVVAKLVPTGPHEEAALVDAAPRTTPDAATKAVAEWLARLLYAFGAADREWTECVEDAADLLRTIKEAGFRIEPEKSDHG